MKQNMVPLKREGRAGNVALLHRFWLQQDIDTDPDPSR